MADGKHPNQAGPRTSTITADRSVTDLVERAVAGDQRAWDAIVERFSGLVWSVARSYRLDHATAADVCQTTWLRAVEHLGRIRNPESLGAWLATTAGREALRLVEHRRRNVPSDVVEELVEPAFPDPAARLVAGERAAEVAAAFGKLSAEDQQLLRLCTADPPLSYTEIAGILGRPVGSIGPSRARALEQLRRRLAAVEAAPVPG